MSKNKIYLLTAFLEGLSVMTVELAGAQMMSSFYGSSLYVWCSVLGITLLGLTCGYFLGGKLSEKFPSEFTLYFILFPASGLIVLMPLIGEYTMTIALNLNLIEGIIRSGMVLLFPPLVLLGMICPILIKQIAKEVTVSGKSAGTIFSISTVGGIVAALSLGFYVIPNFGVSKSVFIVGGILGLYSLVYSLYYRKMGHVFVTIIVIGFVLLSIRQRYTVTTKSSKFNVIYSSEGILGQIRVVDDITDVRTLLVNNIPQTKMHKTGRSLWPYVYRIATYASVKPQGSRVLLAGVGGGNLANEMHVLGFDVEMVDIDSRMSMIAQNYFNAVKEIDTHIDDFRHFVKTTAKRYDIIIIDLSAGEDIPSNVFTIEAFQELKMVLANEGVVFIHYLSTLVGDGMMAVESIGNTIQAAGFDVRMLNTFPQIDRVSELIFVASEQPLDFSALSYRIDPEIPNRLNFPLTNNIYLKDVVFENGLILTDDQPILDVIQQKSTMLMRRNNIKRVIKPLIEDNIDILLN